MDDGSTDGSPELLDAYAAKDARIRALHRENCGVAETRNVGVGLARGEYILFVDSDDYIAQRTCEVLVATAEREGADIVVFGGKTFPTLPWADDSFAWRDSVYHSGVDALLYERGSIPLMCNKMYRTPISRLEKTTPSSSSPSRLRKRSLSARRCSTFTVCVAIRR